MRAALQAFQLRENLRRCGSTLRWLASDYDLADSMTKKKGDSREGILKFMATWHWTIAYDPNFVEATKEAWPDRRRPDRSGCTECEGEHLEAVPWPP